MRRVLAAAATTALAALVSPASAVPAVDQLVGGTAEFNLTGRDLVTYNVHVEARVSRVGTRIGQGEVLVRVLRCAAYRCAKPVTYRAQLTAQQLTVEPDLAAAHLRLLLFGKPLVLDWADPETQPLPQYDGSTVRVYRIAHTMGVVAGRPCETATAMVLMEHVATAEAPVVPKALPTRAPSAFRSILSSACQYSEEAPET
jgi:hypothetical protein